MFSRRTARPWVTTCRMLTRAASFSSSPARRPNGLASTAGWVGAAWLPRGWKSTSCLATTTRCLQSHTLKSSRRSCGRASKAFRRILSSPEAARPALSGRPAAALNVAATFFLQSGSRPAHLEDPAGAACAHRAQPTDHASLLEHGAKREPDVHRPAEAERTHPRGELRAGVSALRASRGAPRGGLCRESARPDSDFAGVSGGEHRVGRDGEVVSPAGSPAHAGVPAHPGRRAHQPQYSV